MTRIEPLILRRAPRSGPDWHHATSHIGGLPALESRPWPRGKAGQPLHFLAQVDLAEVAQHRPDSGLPHTGLLLFFAATFGHECAVLHVETSIRKAALPKDTPPLYGENHSYVFKFATSAEAAPRQVAYWPLDFHPAPLEQGEQVLGDEAEAVANRLGRVTETHESMVAAFSRTCQAIDQKKRPHGLKWHHSFQLYADSVIGEVNDLPRHFRRLGEQLQKGEAYRKALVKEPGRFAKLFGAKQSFRSPEAEKKYRQSWEATVPTLRMIDAQRELVPEFHAFATELADWADGFSPWDEITDQHLSTFHGFVRRRADAFREFSSPRYSPHALNWVAQDTLRHMITGPDTLWQMLPEAFRDHVNARDLFPWDSAGWHQMFGRGRDIQGGVYERADETLLLQLTHDDLIWLDQGDVGAMSFWLSPEDIAAGRWERSELMFECH